MKNLLSTLTWLGLTVCSASSVADSRPNVILILADDLGYGDVACHGNPWLKTPHLDRMRAESVRLEDFHVDPVCTPTRAALLTGRHSIRVGAWSVTEGRQLLNAGETTMAQVFAASGYRTGMFGKWHLGDNYPYAPRFRGFHEVVKHMAGGIDEIGNPIGNDYFDPIASVCIFSRLDNPFPKFIKSFARVLYYEVVVVLSCSLLSFSFS